MRITSKGQVTVPEKIRKKLGLHPGDEVEFEVEGNTAKLIPVKTIKVPKDQAWFWTREWQEKEKEAEEALKKEKYKEHATLSELLEDLHS